MLSSLNISNMDGFNSLLKGVGLCVLLYFFKNFFGSVYSFFLRPSKNVLSFGKWGIVTGATDGIGKALAMELAKKGLNVLLISRTQSRLDDVKSEIENKYNNITVETLTVDCSHFDERARANVKKVVDRIGDIGVLFNNVGVSYDYPQYFAELSDDRVNALLNLNVACATWMTKIVIPGMVQRERGAIVNLSSGSARICSPLLSEYAASKTYIEQFTRCLAAEYAGKGISVQCHTPMFVTTKLAKIRRSSFFVPSPKTYAESAIRNLGYETICSPYWPHALQLFIYESIPEFLASTVVMTMHLSLRSRALKKKEAKTE